MKRNYYRELLIDKTVSVIANEGLDKTTTKAIVQGTDINESYIYRFFRDKEELLVKTFSALDDELVDRMFTAFAALGQEGLKSKTQWEWYVSSIWNFFLENPEKSIAYARYYYSQYYWKYSAAEHKKRHAPLVTKLQRVLRPGGDAWMLSEYILHAMLNFAVRVCQGEIPQEENTARQVLSLIYNGIRSCLDESHINCVATS